MTVIYFINGELAKTTMHVSHLCLYKYSKKHGGAHAGDTFASFHSIVYYESAHA